MRRILVEAARRKQSQRAGGDWNRLELSNVDVAWRGDQVDVLALNEALDALKENRILKKCPPTKTLHKKCQTHPWEGG